MIETSQRKQILGSIQFVRYAKTQFNWKLAAKHLAFMSVPTYTPSLIVASGGGHTHIDILGLRGADYSLV
jgi:hypothetical protein